MGDEGAIPEEFDEECAENYEENKHQSILDDILLSAAVYELFKHLI
tara:strand:+ start:1652 stop:1789 length:138 start_codon:yes stop_codon:yes gene_type:complete